MTRCDNPARVTRNCSPVEAKNLYCTPRPVFSRMTERSGRNIPHSWVVTAHALLVRRCSRKLGTHTPRSLNSALSRGSADRDRRRRPLVSPDRPACDAPASGCRRCITNQASTAPDNDDSHNNEDHTCNRHRSVGAVDRRLRVRSGRVRNDWRRRHRLRTGGVKGPWRHRLVLKWIWIRHGQPPVALVVVASHRPIPGR
jgi:hypothetical protein